ncbi:MAG: hypothetical protein ACOH16_14395 [Propionibacteriaceae bacterium]
MNIETADDQPTSGHVTPAKAPIVDPGYVPPATHAPADGETTVPVTEAHDIVQEDEDDFVESSLDAVEDIRSESVINHFRV